MFLWNFWNRRLAAQLRTEEAITDMKNERWVERMAEFGDECVSQALRLGWTDEAGPGPAAWTAAEIERLRAQVAYLEHYSMCCGCCPECDRLWQAVMAASEVET